MSSEGAAESLRGLRIPAEQVEIDEDSKTIVVDGRLSLHLPDHRFGLLAALALAMKRLRRLKGLAPKQLLRYAQEYVGRDGEVLDFGSTDTMYQAWRQVVQATASSGYESHYMKYSFAFAGEQEKHVRDLGDEGRLFLEELFPYGAQKPSRTPTYAISVKSLDGLIVRRHADALASPQTGDRFKAFLAHLGRQGVPIQLLQYQHMTEMFVPPREYARAHRLLCKRGIVLVLGPPHLGKTFMAANMLWHYFPNRKPRWLLAKDWNKEPRPNRRRPSFVLDNETSLAEWVVTAAGSDTITYVEDPLGRISADEIRASRLDPSDVMTHLVDYVRRSAPGAMVIITSRESLFGKSILPQPLMGEVAVRLRPTSYRKADRDELLLRHARLFRCAWRDKLPTVIPEAHKKLATPHAITVFCKWSRKACTIGQCRKSLTRAGRELTVAFANEVADLPNRPLAVLLAGVYVGGWGTHARVAVSKAFPSLASWDDSTWKATTESLAGIAVVNEHGNLALAHESYEDALDMALRVRRIRRLFDGMLHTLAGGDTDSRALASIALCRGLGRGVLTPKTRGIVRRFAGDAEQRVRLELAAHLPVEVKRFQSGEWGVLEMLAKDDDTDVRTRVAVELARLVNRVGPRGKRILKGLTADIAEQVRAAIAFHVELDAPLSETGARVLRAFADDQSVAVRRSMVRGLVIGFRQQARHALPLLRRMTADEDAEVRGELASILAQDYGLLSVSDKRALKHLSLDPDAHVARRVARGLSAGTGRLDRQGREMWERLARHPSSSVRLGLIDELRTQPGQLDVHSSSVVEVLLEDPAAEVRKGVARYLVRTAKGDVSPNHLKWLRLLAEDSNPAIRRFLAEALAREYEKTSADVRRLVEALAEDADTSVPAELARALGQRQGELPERARALFGKLAHDGVPEVKQQAATGLALGIKTLGKEGRALLGRLGRSRNPEVRKAVARNWFANITEIHRDLGRVIRRLTKDNNDEVRMAAAKSLGAGFARRDGPTRRLLLSLASDSSDSVRATAAYCLAANCSALDAEARKRLTTLTADPSPTVRNAIRGALLMEGDRNDPYVNLLLTRLERLPPY